MLDITGISPTSVVYLFYTEQRFSKERRGKLCFPIILWESNKYKIEIVREKFLSLPQIVFITTFCTYYGFVAPCRLGADRQRCRSSIILY